MPRIRKDLTPEQALAIQAVRHANEAVRKLKTTAREEAKRRVEADILRASLEESRLVRKAIAAGAPKTRIGIEGLGTSDPAAVAKSLARLVGAEDEHDAAPVKKGAKAKDLLVLSWADADRNSIRVVWNEEGHAIDAIVSRNDKKANPAEGLDGWIETADDDLYRKLTGSAEDFGFQRLVSSWARENGGA